jgi:hypothetical protein
VSGIDVTSLGDGTLTYAARAEDSVGNTSGTTTRTATKSTTVAAPVFATWTDPITNGNRSRVGASGTAPAGSRVTLVISDSATGRVTRTSGVVPANGAWSFSTIDVSAFVDGAVTYTATATLGGVTSSAATVTTTKR